MSSKKSWVCGVAEAAVWLRLHPSQQTCSPLRFIALSLIPSGPSHKGSFILIFLRAEGGGSWLCWVRGNLFGQELSSNELI